MLLVYCHVLFCHVVDGTRKKNLSGDCGFHELQEIEEKQQSCRKHIQMFGGFFSNYANQSPRKRVVGGEVDKLKVRIGMIKHTRDSLKHKGTPFHQLTLSKFKFTWIHKMKSNKNPSKKRVAKHPYLWINNTSVHSRCFFLTLATTPP